MKFTRNSLLTALQFALIGALLAQAIMAVYIIQKSLNIFSTMVIRACLQDWAWSVTGRHLSERGLPGDDIGRPRERRPIPFFPASYRFFLLLAAHDFS